MRILGCRVSSQNIVPRARALPRRLALGLLAALLGLLGVVEAGALEKPPNPWSKIRSPAGDEARAIGEYSTGCLRGGSALPMDGPGFVVMHPTRLRYYGHPDLVAYITTLGNGMKLAGLDPVLVGDLSQPRGGPAPGGHASHQTGLDVDLWFWHPGGKLKASQREALESRSILDGKQGTIRAMYAKRVTELLRLTSRDPRVNRMFVHPIIKRQLCSEAGDDRAWLQKVRPWYGHDDHVHVRLTCPTDSKDCTPQPPLAAGDGCAELSWWFSPEAAADRAESQKKYQAKVGKAPGLPEQCHELLQAKR